MRQASADLLKDSLYAEICYVPTESREKVESSVLSVHSTFRVNRLNQVKIQRRLQAIRQNNSSRRIEKEVDQYSQVREVNRVCPTLRVNIGLTFTWQNYCSGRLKEEVDK
jgi:hypothetical protein